MNFQVCEAGITSAEVVDPGEASDDLPWLYVELDPQRPRPALLLPIADLPPSPGL